LKITLKELNDSYQALLRLAQKELPKEQHKLAYKLSRIVKGAKGEIEALNESQIDLMRKCGFVQGEQDVEPRLIDDFNRQSLKFMRETMTGEIWGDPIRLSELVEHVSISPLDLALLDWLIVEEEAQAAKASPGRAD
jgi:hypothetical protein